MENKELDIGWSQGYMGLEYHMQEALDENNLNPQDANSCPPIALFSKIYYNELNNTEKQKQINDNDEYYYDYYENNIYEDDHNSSNYNSDDYDDYYCDYISEDDSEYYSDDY